MTIQTEEDLEKLRRVGQSVARVLQALLAQVEPGVTTGELDALGAELLEREGVESAPKTVYEFPGFTCISVNEEAAHGIPGERVIQPGDVVNIDVSATREGYFADTGGTVVAPPAASRERALVSATQVALREVCKSLRAGKPLSIVGKSIQRVAREKRFHVIENLCSHGVGRSLHEDPKEIPSFYDPHDRRRLHEGMVLAIEPFLSTRSVHVREAADGWTVVGEAGNRSAQFEHTIVVTRGKPIILTVA